MLRLLIALILFTIALPSFSAGEGFVVESIGSTANIEARKRLVETVLGTGEMRLGYRALSIVLDSKLIEPRWQMKGHTIRLSPNVSQEGEFVKLLVHEVGHYLDIYTLMSATRSQSDPSDLFYAISWESPKTKKPTETLASFVSGYAATNQYEDFAESFTFYIFHNDEFADRALRNDSLREKYLFFSKNVFPDTAFAGTDFRTGKVPSYLWDTTKVPISVKKYLYFLRE